MAPLALMLATLLAVLPAPAPQDPITPRQQCLIVSANAEGLARGRDEGLTAEQAVRWVYGLYQRGLADQDDVKAMLWIAAFVFNHPDRSPTDVGADINELCLRMMGELQT